MKNSMMMLAMSLTLFACQNSKPTEAATTAAPEVTKPVEAPLPPPPSVKADTMCFEMKFKKDISTVKLIIAGDDVTGDYHWHPNEKDGGHGTLKGKKNGNLITADWNYMIEGSTQVEEVVFKMEGNKLLKAEGELEEKTGKLVIKNMAKVKFSETFNTIDCSKVKLDEKM